MQCIPELGLTYLCHVCRLFRTKQENHQFEE